jgi:hypothetical protein
MGYAETEDVEVRPHPCVVLVDETQLWFLDDVPHRDRIKSIYGAYVYDRNSHTHICSLTPSYWLLQYDTVVTTVSGTSDEVREEIMESLERNFTYHDDYFDVQSIKQLEEDPDIWTSFGEEDSSWRLLLDGDTYEEQYDNYMEAIRQGCQENAPL